MRPSSFWRDSRALLLGAIVLLAVSAAILLLRAHDAPPPGGTGSVADSPADLDGDGRPDPVELKRLGASPAAAPIIEAIRAAGGFGAWQSHRSVSYRVRGVFFDDRGFITEERSERCLMELTMPRVAIESQDGRTRLGVDERGPWGAAIADNGLWSTSAGPGALPAGLLANLTLEPWWLFGLPFRWGDIDARIDSLALPADRPANAPADSLARVVITGPPAPGDTAARIFTAGFDRSSGFLRELEFRRPRFGSLMPAGGSEATGEGNPGDGPPPGAGDRFVLTFSDELPTGGLVLPHRRQLALATPEGSRFPLFELTFEDLVWDPPTPPGAFARPVD